MKEIETMKKILALTLALVMALGLVACGGASSSTPAASTPAASTPAASTGTDAPAEGGEILRCV